MAQSNVNMSKLKRSFQMLAAKIPQRTICEQLHMGRGVLNRYKTLADSQGLSYGVIGRMSDGEIESFLQLSKPTAAPSSQRQVLDGLLPEYVSDLSHNRYLTIQALHESYKKEHPDGYGYTQFKKSIREYQYSHNLSFHNTYIPGEEMQIDFAGDALWLTDPKTGELTKVVVLVCILPYSGLGFAKAMYNASMENFFGGISDAFSYFGGTTRIAKSDNMKQWVKKYDRYEPAFNDAAVEWAAYYDTTLQTCRVRTPRDKGPVEGLVQKTYNAVYALLHDEVFYNLLSMNTRIYELMDGFNEKPSRTTGRSRRDIFEAEEQPTLGKLPMTPYRFRYRKEVKLSGTYHVMVDKHNYSVPYQYVGQKVSVLWDLDTVEVYSGSSRIAIHQRRQGSGYSTLDEHMPDKHLAYKHGQGYNAAYFLEEAALVGSNTTSAVQSILNRTKLLEESKRICERTHGADGELMPESLVRALDAWTEDDDRSRRERLAQAVCGVRPAKLRGRELADALVRSVQEVRRYDENTVLNLYICWAQNFLTVLSGEPGSGKTSICHILARTLGLDAFDNLLSSDERAGLSAGRFVHVPVEYGWTSKRDFVGYWNPITNRFESSDPARWDLLRTLDAEERSASGSVYPAMMLLDEANLSPMEYYWSDWMRLCDEQTSSGIVTLWDKAPTKVPETLRFMRPSTTTVRPRRSRRASSTVQPS